MFLDAREIEQGAVLDTELCVIGAGAAGITIAREFAWRRAQVLILESGGLDFAWDVQDLSRGPQGGLPYYALDVCQLRYFGGNTNAWGGWCRPLDAIDFEHRPWVKHSGWPFGRAHLQPWYERAHRICGVRAGDYDPADWVRRLASPRARLLDLDPAKLKTTIYQFSPPTRFGIEYRKDVTESTSVRCLLHAHALRLCAAHDGRSLARIEVGTLTGKRFAVHAKAFVLATGGVENARLLLLSDDIATNGVGNGHDLVGRYFMEHPHTKRAIVPIDPRAPIGLYGLSFYDRGVSARVALPSPLQEREGILNYSANLHPLYLGHDTPGWFAFRKLVFQLTPSRDIDPYIRFPPHGRKGLSRREAWDIARQFPQVVAASLLQLLQPAGFVNGFILESKPEQAPNPESRVTLVHERDPFNLPRARLDWRMLAIDRRTSLKGEALVDGELRRLGIGNAKPWPAEEAGEDGRWPANLEGGWHQIGTTRMHEDPRRGVVDPDCRVHGMENLFIAGSSVFPTGGAAPPTLTIVALALRLADRLKEFLEERPRATAAPPPAPGATADVA